MTRGDTPFYCFYCRRMVEGKVVMKGKAEVVVCEHCGWVLRIWARDASS